MPEAADCVVVVVVDVVVVVVIVECDDEADGCGRPFTSDTTPALFPIARGANWPNETLPGAGAAGAVPNTGASVLDCGRPKENVAVDPFVGAALCVPKVALAKGWWGCAQQKRMGGAGAGAENAGVDPNGCKGLLFWPLPKEKPAVVDDVGELPNEPPENPPKGAEVALPKGCWWWDGAPAAAPLGAAAAPKPKGAGDDGAVNGDVDPKGGRGLLFGLAALPNQKPAVPSVGAWLSFAENGSGNVDDAEACPREEKRDVLL